VFRRLEQIGASRFTHRESASPDPAAAAIVRAAVPVRLKPTAPIASDAILVGDPGRALLLAQELLEQPKMSNHARGLWGYSGQTADNLPLTIQATGMGGPSAALVLADLAELGVRRAVRVGTCIAFGAAARPGELLAVEAALAVGGSAASFEVAAGQTVAPDPGLHRRLTASLGEETRAVTVASLDTVAGHPEAAAGAAAADMQTLAVLASARALGVAAAALLIATETEAGESLRDESLEEVTGRAGRAAADALSNPQVEG
jgi:purine-nucleoside phosphorylase